MVARRHHSLLIEGNKIARTAPRIAPPSPHTKILDDTGKKISPGFIDTHDHSWQAQLKRRHADHTLKDYTSTRDGDHCQAVIAKQRVDWRKVAIEMLCANELEHMVSGTKKMFQLDGNKFV